MAIFGLSNEWFENLALETRPKRYYSSASLDSPQTTGITGSVYVFAERSKFEKEAQPLQAFDDSAPVVFGDDSIEGFREAVIASASLTDPEQIQQVTELNFQLEDVYATLEGISGTLDRFDHRNLLGWPSNQHIHYAYFDLSEPYGDIRRFYFYDSNWGNAKRKPDIPDKGSRHMIDLVELNALGDPHEPTVYDVEEALALVTSATCEAINSVSAFEATFTSDINSANIVVTNTRYGICQTPVTGVILNPYAGGSMLDVDVDGDGIGDQDLPIFPYNIFDIEVTTSGSATSINAMLDRYMELVNDSEISSRKQTAVSITRFEPSFQLTSDSLRKSIIKDVLFPHYRIKHPELHWAFSNYNTINFFTSSLVPSDTALVYPSFTDETVQPSIIPYVPSGSFTFEFYINPRYTIDEVDSYASGSFMVVDWEQLFIDFHQGGRGAHELPILDDYAEDVDGNLYWYLTEGDSTAWDTAIGWGFVDDAAIEASGDYTQPENLVTDKGDEAPDYDFRSGDPIIKNCSIILDDMVPGTDPQVFTFTAPGSINNVTDWTVGKNEVGDFDNYETAVNIAKTIDNNEYFKSWPEKIEIVDEEGQQKVNEAEELLWTDDNGLNEYSLDEALEKDFPDEEDPTMNSYQATSSDVLLWTDGAEEFSAESKDYGAIVGWVLEGADLADQLPASDLGYTGYFDPEDGSNLDGYVDVNGNQYWWKLPSDGGGDPNTSATLGYEGYYLLADNTNLGLADVDLDDDGAIDDLTIHGSWTEEEWAEQVADGPWLVFEGEPGATAWSEQAWADFNGYIPVYEDVDGSEIDEIPDEIEWMTDPLRAYAAVYTAYTSEDEWASGQDYEAIITYVPTVIYGKVWVQTLIPGYAGNVAEANITTTQQTEFTWYAWEKVNVDTDDDGVPDTLVWQWEEKTEDSPEVDEDAMSAFADSDGCLFEWSEGPTYTAGIEVEGGRNHVIGLNGLDRDASHQFPAGTILHMSSSYAISLVTGSHIDIAGHPDTYRLILQLSSSADIPPAEMPLIPGLSTGEWEYEDEDCEDCVYDTSKIFLSSDNALQRNNWHHIAIRWGTDLIDDGKLQLLIDGRIDSEFDLYGWEGFAQEFGDMTPRIWPEHEDDEGEVVAGGEDLSIEADPAALFVGNFFEGHNGSVYEQATVPIDGDGNASIEDEAVSEKYAWYIQEKNLDGYALWTDDREIEDIAPASRDALDPSYDILKTDVYLRNQYFIALKADTLSELGYTPILSSTLAYDVGDLETEFGADYVYNEVLSIDSESTQYVQGMFSYEASQQYGVTWGRVDDVDSESGWTEDDPDPLEVNDYQLRHPLNAELHEIKIWNEYRTFPQIWESQKDGLEELEENLLFYLPPFFVKESRERDVMLTPFQTMTSTTDDPFNVAMSFGVGGHLLNLENFCRELVAGEYPLLINLTGTTIDETTQEAKEANEFLNEDPNIRKRNLTILPCDNGLFVPDFTVLTTGSYSQKPDDDLPSSKFVNDYGTLNLGLVTLRNMVPEEMMFPGLIAISDDGTDDISDDSIFAAIAGSTPENPGVAPGSVLAILQRTRDTSSNEVVFFDVSNLFYGKKITPKTFELTDNDVTGSGGKVKITLKDNGYGVLYRADAETTNPLWASVGHIIYEEGIAIVQNPCIPYFGKEQFEVSLEGNHNIHIMEILVPCQAGSINSSSNPRYEELKVSSFASERDSEFVYITGLNFHDENLNIVARTNLAQPIIKRDGDSLTFRVKVDF